VFGNRKTISLKPASPALLVLKSLPVSLLALHHFRDRIGIPIANTVIDHESFESNALPKNAQNAARGNEMPKKVLLVDDSTTTLMMEEMILKERTTYQCVTATDGLDAISRAVVEMPDLVLMDVVMPRMNGFEACKRMRLEKSLSQTPIILVTTRGEEEYVEAGFQSGCNDYITKPINSFELVTLLQSYLGE
jgi:CheY-like chemotaxis protein